MPVVSCIFLLRALFFSVGTDPHSILLSIQKGSENFRFLLFLTIPSGTVRFFAMQHKFAGSNRGATEASFVSSRAAKRALDFYRSNFTRVKPVPMLYATENIVIATVPKHVRVSSIAP
jgi:hypothetical protein